jgi:hypothetical protein
LVGLGLALSLDKDDLNSFLYSMGMLTLIFLSMKKMGENIPLQRKISLVMLAIYATILISEWLLMNYLEPTLDEHYSHLKEPLLTFGFTVITNENTGSLEFERWDSVRFEL